MDVIQSDRHWSDEYVLDLTVTRALQIVNTILRRRFREASSRFDLAKWQTQRLGLFMAHLAMSEEAGKQIMKEAMSLSGGEVPEPGPQVNSFEDVMAAFGGM